MAFLRGKEGVMRRGSRGGPTADRGVVNNPGEQQVVERERAEQFGTMIAIHIEFGRIPHCHRILDWAEREIAEGREPDLRGDEVWLADLVRDDIPDGGKGGAADFRIVSSLEHVGIFLAEEAAELTEDELIERVPNFGAESVKRLREMLGPWMAANSTRPAS